MNIMFYFIITLIYSLLIPYILQVILLQSSLTVLSNEIILVIIMAAACFAVMMAYGYGIMRIKHPRKPETLLGIYLPVLFPLVWYLIWAGIFNILGLTPDDFSQLFLGLLTFNFFGMFCGSELLNINIFSSYHNILILNLFYYSIIILGFAMGEQLSVYKTGKERKFFKGYWKLTTAIVFLAVIVSFYIFSECALYYQRQNIVPDAHPSYRFSYEGGYSSIDLNPYHVENEKNILAKLNGNATLVISNPEDMPVLDGAEAAYPVYAAFANACYEDIAQIQADAKGSGKNSSDEMIRPIQFSNTIYAYEKLLNGDVDIFFGAKPSAEQLQIAEDAGKELVLTPIAKEAFVFFVSAENPINGLSSEQLRDIYSGKINNWRKVGGEDEKILAFQRPENSGSQTMMEYFMGDRALRAPLEAEYVQEMSGLVRSVADYENSSASLGYSFRYYLSIMMEADKDEDNYAGIKMLAVDNIYPDAETIRSGEYSLTTQLYAITVKDNPKDTVNAFVDWMIGPQGQQLISDTGYIAIY